MRASRTSSSPYNILGAEKLARLAALNERIADAEGRRRQRGDGRRLVGALSPRQKPLTVLVECDTGGGRCGVQSAGGGGGAGARASRPRRASCSAAC